MKIMVVMGEYPPEEAERRRAAVLKCASSGTEIGFSVIKATFFIRANAQINALAAGPLVAEAAQKAQADGFDVVVPFGTLDAGVELARNLVRIPVVGAGQSVMHLAVQLSNRLGVVAYEKSSIPFMRKQMHAWRVWTQWSALTPSRSRFSTALRSARPCASVFYASPAT